MIFRVVTFFSSACLALTLIASAQEPVKPPLNPRIVTATKQVVLFSSLEKHML